MGLFDAILGRTKPKMANLDALFQVPGAALSLDAALGFHPSGKGSVCYRAVVGSGFAETQGDIVQLLSSVDQAPEVELSTDDYGFTWLEVQHRAGPDGTIDTSSLCTDLHAVNTGLESQGYGPSLLCSVIPFADAQGRTFGLVYLYKQGTFFPFAPRPDGSRSRDNMLEIQIADTLGAELPMEPDKQRWLAVWGAPGL